MSLETRSYKKKLGVDIGWSSVSFFTDSLSGVKDHKGC